MKKIIKLINGWYQKTLFQDAQNKIHAMDLKTLSDFSDYCNSLKNSLIIDEINKENTRERN